MSACGILFLGEGGEEKLDAVNTAGGVCGNSFLELLLKLFAAPKGRGRGRRGREGEEEPMKKVGRIEKSLRSVTPIMF